MGELVSDLEASSEELIETHISWVFLRGGEVFKVKKPVNFGFLNFSELSGRRLACLAEVQLNARLAPNVYIGVVPVTRGVAGLHTFGGSGEVVDHAVHMRRLPDAARADLRLEGGQLDGADLEALAGTLARFHAQAATSVEIAEYGGADAIARNVKENFEQARAVLRQLGSDSAEREVEERQLAFLREHADVIARRAATGRVRDGHGDLRLEHVYLVDGAEPVVIDCIEFNQRFRFADVCADVAFLSMDLAWHERPDLKERFLAAYARASQDYDMYAVVDFYESYRAYVRAKVTAFSLASRSLSFHERELLESHARRYLLLSLAAERPRLGSPQLIAVGGIIGTGKSSVAGAMGERLAVPVLSSDETRKALHGVAPMTKLSQAPWQAQYSPATSAAVYDEVLRRARVVLGSGRSLVIDASFRSQAHRAAARRLAVELGVAFRFVECRASEHIVRARLKLRSEGPSVSDGSLALFDEFVARYEPVTELGSAEHLRVDTGRPLAATLAELELAEVIPRSSS